MNAAKRPDLKHGALLTGDLKHGPLSGDETAAVEPSGVLGRMMSRDGGCSWEAQVGQAAGNRWAASPALFVAAPATCPGVL